MKWSILLPVVYYLEQRKTQKSTTGTCGQDTASPLFTPYPPFFIYIYISVDWCNQKTASLYTYQSTYAIRKRHIIAVLHISKPWKWKKKEKKNEKKGGCCVSCPQVPVRFTCNNKSILKSTLLFFGINAI